MVGGVVGVRVAARAVGMAEVRVEVTAGARAEEKGEEARGWEVAWAAKAGPGRLC
jgi:hypothetical protein